MSSAKCRPFCLGLNVLKMDVVDIVDGISCYTGLPYNGVLRLKLLLNSSWICYLSHTCCAGIILCMHPANRRRRYNVRSSLIGWAHTQNDPCLCRGIGSFPFDVTTPEQSHTSAKYLQRKYTHNNVTQMTNADIGLRNFRIFRCNLLWPVDSPHKGLVMGRFDVFCNVSLNSRVV